MGVRSNITRLIVFNQYNSGHSVRIYVSTPNGMMRSAMQIQLTGRIQIETSILTILVENY